MVPAVIFVRLAFGSNFMPGLAQLENSRRQTLDAVSQSV